MERSQVANIFIRDTHSCKHLKDFGKIILNMKTALLLRKIMIAMIRKMQNISKPAKWQNAFIFSD